VKRPPARQIAVAVFLLLLLLLVGVLATVGLHQLFIGSTLKESAAWSSAIGAASLITLVLVTIALVVVTTVYVLFTRQLVRLQGDVSAPAKAHQREEAANDVATLLAQYLPVSRPGRQPATEPPGSYPDETCIRRQRRACRRQFSS
jgi:hypothetical protein